MKGACFWIGSFIYHLNGISSIQISEYSEINLSRKQLKAFHVRQSNQID